MLLFLLRGASSSPPPVETTTATSLWLRAIAEVYSDLGITIAADTDAVQQWNDQSGNNLNVTQGTSGSRPVYHSSLPSLTFDGSDDYLSIPDHIDDTSGTIAILFKTGASFSSKQVLLSSADTGSANNWFEIGIDTTPRIYIERNVSGTKHTVVGSSFLEASTAYALFVVYDGLDYYAQLNSVEQNPLTITSVGTFGWLGHVSSPDNITIAGTVTSDGLVRPFGGDILEIKITAIQAVATNITDGDSDSSKRRKSRKRKKTSNEDDDEALDLHIFRKLQAKNKLSASQRTVSKPDRLMKLKTDDDEEEHIIMVHLDGL